MAGASGVIGQELLPLLVADGHVVAGMTRSAEGAAVIEASGAQPVTCDVYDLDALVAAVVAFAPDLVLHQLTDLPDDPALIPTVGSSNNRMRREGTTNLLAAAQAAAARRVVAQSIAWDPPGDATVAKADLEQAVMALGGLVLRYGQLYGPGTYHPIERPEPPRVALAEAARRTVELLDAPPGTYEVLDPI